MSDQHKIIQHELTQLVQAANAHVMPQHVLTGIPEEAINQRVDGVPYTIWELTEHMRLAQWDIIDFALYENHTTPPWPEGFWPSRPANDKNEFEESVQKFLNHLDEIVSMIKSPDMDFFAAIEHAPNYTFFRQFMLLADHNAYHTGQVVTIRRILNIWNI